MSIASIVERVDFIYQEVEGHTCWYLEAMEECIDPVFYARVIVKGIAVKIIKLKSVPFKDGALERCGNVGFHKGKPLEDDQVLETLDK